MSLIEETIDFSRLKSQILPYFANFIMVSMNLNNDLKKNNIEKALCQVLQTGFIDY